MQDLIDSWLNTLNQKANSKTLLSRSVRDLREVKYVLEYGRKYIKIVRQETWKDISGTINHNNQIHKSVHAFIDGVTGDIYKPAGWKAPAKGVRFNILRDIESLLKVCDDYGSYLYIR